MNNPTQVNFKRFTVLQPFGVHKRGNKFSIAATVLVIVLVSRIKVTTFAGFVIVVTAPASAQPAHVTITAILAAPKDRWDILVKDSLQEALTLTH